MRVTRKRNGSRSVEGTNEDFCSQKDNSFTLLEINKKKKRKKKTTMSKHCIYKKKTETNVEDLTYRR
jgi:protein-arginine kinase